MSRVLYKFTDENMCTYGNTQWVLNEWKETDGQNYELCNSSWLHAYEDPYVATLLHTKHVSWLNPRLFRAEGQGKYLADTDGKCGVTRLQLTEEIPIPKITIKQKANITCCCALEIAKQAKNSTLIKFFQNFLNGKMPSKDKIKETLDFYHKDPNDQNGIMYYAIMSIRKYVNYIKTKKRLNKSDFDCCVTTVIYRSVCWFGINIVSCIYKGLYIK